MCLCVLLFVLALFSTKVTIASIKEMIDNGLLTTKCAAVNRMHAAMRSDEVTPEEQEPVVERSDAATARASCVIRHSHISDTSNHD